MSEDVTRIDLDAPLRALHPKRAAWVGDDLVQGPVRAVVVEFHGQGYADVKEAAKPSETWLGERGALSVFPYFGPWGWMNRKGREYTEWLLDRIWSEYGLPADLPLVVTGGSMGGLGALLFSCLTKRRLAGCYALYPVCDGEAILAELPEQSRIFAQAFWDELGPLRRILREHSPLRQVDKLPDIPYLILHGDADQQVCKDTHSDPMVAAMRARGLNVEYVVLPGFGHEEPPPEVDMRRAAFAWQCVQAQKASTV